MGIMPCDRFLTQSDKLELAVDTEMERKLCLIKHGQFL